MPTRSGLADISQPGTVAVDTVAHGDTTTAGDYVNSLTFAVVYQFADQSAERRAMLGAPN